MQHGSGAELNDELATYSTLREAVKGGDYASVGSQRGGRWCYDSNRVPWEPDRSACSIRYVDPYSS